MAFNWYSNIPFKYKLLSKILFGKQKRDNINSAWMECWKLEC